MKNPFSLHDFQNIRKLCELEESRYSKIATRGTIFCSLILLTAITSRIIGSSALGDLVKFVAFFSLIYLVPFSFTLGPYVKLTIEGVTFKSFDHLGKNKTQSDDHFYPSANSENLYAPGTINYDFVEKIRQMDRPLMRFEVDILNSIQ